MKALRPLSLLPLLVAPLAAAPESHPCQNGLVRSLVAREPMFRNPVAVAVDVDGSIYVTETTRRKQADLDIREVMQWVVDDLSHTSIDDKRRFFRENITTERFKNHPSLKDHDKNGRIDWQDLTVHSEKIHRLVDTDGDGMADRSTVFAEGFNTEVTGIAAGVMAYRGDVYATIAPDLWKLRDTDGDGVADERKSLVTGFGVHINYAGHDMHGLTFGPDGKVYWTIGDKGTNVTANGVQWLYPHEGALLRCHPDGSEFEVFARGLRNVQEIAFDDYGNIFGVDNDADMKGEKERLIFIPEGSDHGWRAYYQYRGAKYNPWMAERIAFPDGPDRPASILPPLALYHDGPSGLAYNPGTAINDFYRGHFFLTQFPAGKINAFKLEPDGAGFKMTGDHLMAGGTPFVGCNFGPDGALYVADWQGGYPLKEKGAVWKIDDPKEKGSAVRKEVAAMLREGTAKVADEELIQRLAHPDQRVRLDAQWTLATRSKLWSSTPSGYLARVFKAESLIAKVHALWLLSQIKYFDGALFAELAKDPNPELRAQAAKWAGECGPPVPDLAPLLADPSARVRYHAAMAVGRLRANILLPAVVRMIEDNAGRDPMLRHAGQYALRRAGAGHPDELRAIAGSKSTAVRLAATAAIRDIVQDHLRQVPTGGAGAERRFPERHAALLEKLLLDPEPSVVSEAARAVCEEPGIGSAYPALASLLDTKPDARESALRRSIATNRRLGDEASLTRLAVFAADTARPQPLRVAALEALVSVKSSEPLDAVDGHYAPLTPLEIPSELAARLASFLVPASADKSLARQATAALDALGVKRDATAVTRQALDPKQPASLRIVALRHLKAINSPKWTDIALALLKENVPGLRSEAAALLAVAKPEAVIDYLKNTGLPSKDVSQRQASFRLLATLKPPAARQLLEPHLASLQDPACLLEILDAARVLAPERVPGLESALAAKSPLGKWSYALEGGDAATGREIFAENLAANCTACHRIDGEGSNVGPALAGIGAKGREHLLESLVLPQAQVAAGFGLMTATRKDGTVAAGAFLEEKDGKLVLSQPDGAKLEIPLADIAARTAPVSTMFSMDAILKPAELRDLVEFLASLK
jgi:putative membrane-bound dehydrogenase-like protein